MSGGQPHHKKRERGWVLITGALLSVSLFAFLGLSIDVGLAQISRKRVQMAADNAVIAATLELRNSTANAVSAGTFSASLNGFSTANGDTVAVNNPPSSGSYQGNSQAVQVSISHTVPTFFMQILSIQNIQVSAKATGRLKGSGASSGGGCIYVMDTSASRAMMLGGGSVLWSNCGLFVNSTDNSAASNDGQGCYAISNGGINIVGHYGYIWGTGAPAPPNAVPGSRSSPCPNDIVNNKAPSVPAGGYNSGKNFSDPGASLTAPTVGSCTYTNTQVNTSNNHTFQTGGQLHPGTYCGGITLSGQIGTITMQPGLYIMAGGGFQINGGASVTGTGVTIYNTQISGYSYQPFVFTSQGSNAYLTAPTSGTYAGILMFTDRTMTSTNNNQVNGDSNTILQGLIYMPSVPLIISGNGSSMNASSAYTLIVAKTLTINGGGTLNVASDYSSLANGSPLSSGAPQVVLSE